MNPAGAVVERSTSFVMVNLKAKIILPLLILGFISCSSTKPALKSDAYPRINQKYNYYSIGIIEESKGNPAKALHYFKKALQEDPRSVYIYEEIASCYLQMNDYKNGIKYLEQSITIDQTRLESRFMLVNIYIVLKKTDKALEQLNRIVEIDRTNYYAYFDMATIYQDRGDYERAIMHYEKSLDMDDTFTPSYYNLGNIYFNLGQKRKAREYFEKLLQFDEDNYEIKFTYGFILKNIGEYDKAIEYYTNLLSDFPQSLQLYNELCEIYYLMDDIQKCRDNLAIILTNDSHSILFQGIDFELKKDYEKAIGSFKKYLQKEEGNLAATYGLYKIYKNRNDTVELKKVLLDMGKICYANENFKGSLLFLKELKKIAPKDTKSYSSLGIVYELLSEYDKAINEIKAALALKPKDPQLNFYLAILYEKKKNYRQAIRQLEKTARYDKNNVSIYIRLGYIYDTLNDMKNTILNFEKAIKIKPDDQKLYLLLGVSHIRNKKYTNAINTFLQGEKLDPKNPLVHFHLGAAYDKIDLRQKAIKSLQMSYILDKENPDTLNYLAYLYALEGINLEQALEMIKKALILDEENYAYLDTLAWVYYQLKRFDQSLDTIIRARRIMEEDKKVDDVVYEHMGDIYLKKGDKQKAVLFWEKAYKINPRDDLKEKIQGGKKND